MPWGPSVDSFAIGCIIVELITTKPLFCLAESPFERLSTMERVIGRFPQSYSLKVEKRHPGTFVKPTYSYPRIIFPTQFEWITQGEIRRAQKRIKSSSRLHVSRGLHSFRVSFLINSCRRVLFIAQ
jgi:hypothetical protein